MKKRTSKQNSRPWLDPRTKDHPDYDDAWEFDDIRRYLNQHPNEGFSVRLYRQMPNGDSRYLCDGDWFFYDWEDIQQFYGAGVYKIKFMDSKKRFIRTLVLRIWYHRPGTRPEPAL